MTLIQRRNERLTVHLLSDEKCLQMRETEREEVEAQFDKEKVICFQTAAEEG